MVTYFVTPDAISNKNNALSFENLQQKDHSELYHITYLCFLSHLHISKVSCVGTIELLVFLNLNFKSVCEFLNLIRCRAFNITK